MTAKLNNISPLASPVLRRTFTISFIFAFVFYTIPPFVTAQYGQGFQPVFPGNDHFDDIQAKLLSVNEDNCAIKHVGELKLPENTVSHLPDIKEININPVFPNRTALLHLHNMALSRSFFFSYMLQTR